MDAYENLKQKIISKGHFPSNTVLNGYVQVNGPQVLNQLEVFTGCIPFHSIYEIYLWPKYHTLEVNEPSPEEGYCNVNDNIDFHKGKQLVFHQCNFSRGWIPLLLLPNHIESL